MVMPVTLLTLPFVLQVAYKRFSDNVPMQIDTHFVRGLDRDLDLAILSMEITEAKCIEWLQEDPKDVLKRNDLLGKRRRLESAKAQLDIATRPTSLAGL